MDKNTKTHEPKPGEEFRDSLGQPNPAHEFERKNIEEAKKKQEEKDKETKKAEKAG